jgi:hypothetical protein
MVENVHILQVRVSKSQIKRINTNLATKGPIVAISENIVERSILLFLFF